MPWPKGIPHRPEMIHRRGHTLSLNGKRHKKPNNLGQWRCGRCFEWKPPDKFHQDSRSPNGLKSQCRACHSECSLRTRNKELARASRRRSEANRRARKVKAAGTISREALDAIEARFGSECLSCRSTALLQWDHVIPLARGGAHCIANLQRLCRGCNERKQARDFDYRSQEQKLWVVEFKPVVK